MMNGPEKSDSSIVATKSANKPGQLGAESMERREGTEENTGKPLASRTQRREITTGSLCTARRSGITVRFAVNHPR